MRRSERHSARIGVAAAVLALTACSSGGGGGSSTGAAVDDGTTIEMWTRAATSTQSQALVDAYNSSHTNQVRLTVVPNESYLQRVGVAAGGSALPCLLGSDVSNVPQFTTEDIYLDISDRIDALGFADALAPGHMANGTVGGRRYTVPHTIAISVLFQNNALLRRAGIDPTAPVESLVQLARNAKAVADLDDGSVGLYFTGAVGGSVAFTHFPSVWASGGEVLSDDGTRALLDSEEVRAVFTAYNDMYRAGVVPESVRTENGATRNDVFARGNVGYLLASNSLIEAVQASETLDIGVNGIPGVDSGVSTFIGGDVMGIPEQCETPDQAWDFLSWSLSEEAQVGVYSRIGQLTVRTDLARNEFTAADPRLVALNELVGRGRTPYAVAWGEVFNDPNGPWQEVVQAALFGPDPDAVLRDGAPRVTEALGG